jgi:mannuronan synthase
MTTEARLAENHWQVPTETRTAAGSVLLRRGATWPFQAALFLMLAVIVASLLGAVGSFYDWLSHRVEVLVVLGGIGCWRWGWFSTQTVRAAIYRYWKFPRLRRQANEAVAVHGPVPELVILAVTYKEKPWITRAVFESVFNELANLEGLVRPAQVVVATGSDTDDETIHAVYAECCADLRAVNVKAWPPELVLLRDDHGKRSAIGTGLRQIVASNPDPEGAVVFMDGDTMMQAGLLRKVLPLFRLRPEVSGVTTNENGWVQGPRWFAEWISLRFGLRHRTMCSVALSGKLLCLTGRFSVFRGSVATDPTFLRQIEHDTIHHWLWDSFDMLSGDDKSTWFWLAAHGRRMLYVPDAMVTTLEVVTGSAVQRAGANIRRWSGNSLRHSWRAFKLGPKKLGWFCWYSLLDQRLAIWTVLVGPLFALLALGGGHIELAVGYVLWVMLSRLAQAAISWRHGRRFSAFYLPLQVVSDWVIALTKIWILFHPAKQAWMNRGARTLDTTQSSAFYRMRTATAHYLFGFTCATSVLLIGVFTGLLPMLRESALFLNDTVGQGVSVSPATQQLVASPGLMFGMDAPAEVRLPDQTANTPEARGLSIALFQSPENPDPSTTLQERHEQH